MASLPPTTTKHPISPNEIAALNALLAPTGHTLLTPTDPDPTAYNTTLARWSAAASKPAGASLLPSPTTGIAAIQTAVKFATEQNIDLAVKGGGHSTAGASSTTGGLLIDLSQLKAVHVDASTRRVRVGGGATWGDVDVATAASGLACVGGTVADTGVGGLTLGGGYGWLSGRVGLVVDNLLAATLVLADGTLVTASADQNTDLFWAVRGAGQNFGVCVEFVFAAHPVAQHSFGGILFFHPTQPNIEAVVHAANQLYTPDEHGKTKLAGAAAGGIAFARPPLPAEVIGAENVGQTLLMLPVIYHGTESDARRALQPFFDLSPIASTAAMVPYPALNHLLDVPPGLRVSMKGAIFTLPIDVAFVTQALDNFERFIAATPDAAHSLLMWELYDPVQVVSRAGNQDMAFANRGLHLNGMIAPIWTDPATDPICRQWARDVAEMFKAELRRSQEESGVVKGNHGPSMVYGNYDRKIALLPPFCHPRR